MEILKNNNGIEELELLQERINENNRFLIEINNNITILKLKKVL